MISGCDRQWERTVDSLARFLGRTLCPLPPRASQGSEPQAALGDLFIHSVSALKVTPPRADVKECSDLPLFA